jgi:hypothetical protein
MEWTDLLTCFRGLIEHHGGELAYGLLGVGIWIALPPLGRWWLIARHFSTIRKRALDTVARLLRVGAKQDHGPS